MTKKEISTVTLALLLSNLMAGLDGTIINTALPAIISDLDGLAYMGWIIAVFLLGMAVATPLWSKMGERIGNKKTYQIATVLFIIGAVLQALSTQIMAFLLARAVMGIGAGGMNTLPFIIYADLYEDLKKRARVIGYATASFSAASIMGPLIGGWIVDTLSWHWVFYINLPIALISIVLVQIFLQETPPEKATLPIDYPGATYLVISVLTLLVALQLIGSQLAWVAPVLLVIGCGLIVRLFKVEAKALDPIIPNRLFKNRQLVIDFILFVILWAAFIAFNIYIPMWAQGILGMSALLGGMTQIPGAITNLIGSLMGPGIQTRHGKYQTLMIGALAFLIAFVGMIIAGVQTPFWFLLVMGMFEGFGLGVSFNILQVSVQDDAEKQDVPIATSFAYLLRILSQAFMSAIYGVVLNRALQQGIKQSNGELTMSMLNKLSNKQLISQLPSQLLPQMRQIMFNGIHQIMLIAVMLLLIVITLILWLKKYRPIRLNKELTNDSTN